MNIPMQPIRMQWPPGRIAAAVLFVVGTWWAYTFAVRPSFPWIYSPGYLVWSLWGLRAAGLRQASFLKVCWTISALWHLIWFFISLWLLLGSAGFLLLRGWEIIWSILAFLVSMAISCGDPLKR